MSQRQRQIAPLIAMIEAKYQSRGCLESFNGTQRELFNEILANMPVALAVTAVKRLLLFSSSFVPDPAELLLTAAQLASPIPDEDTAWREVFERMSVVRPAPLSHPQILEAVRDLGGYDVLDHNYRFAHTPVGVLRAQFVEAYKRRRGRWETAVRELLLQPVCAWDWSLLPVDNPLLLEVDHERQHLQRGRELAAPNSRRIAPQEEPPAPMPEDVREKLHNLGLGSIARQIDERRP